MPYLLAYLSRSTVKNAPEILEEIAAKSARNNAALGVTGILLLNGNYFFQVLEGREDLVKALFAKIQRDPRHIETRVVVEGEVDQRLFSDWFMRALNLDGYYDVDIAEFRRRLNAVIGGGIATKQEMVTLLKAFTKLVIDTDTYRQRG